MQNHKSNVGKRHTSVVQVPLDLFQCFALLTQPLSSYSLREISFKVNTSRPKIARIIIHLSRYSMICSLSEALMYLLKYHQCIPRMPTSLQLIWYNWSIFQIRFFERNIWCQPIGFLVPPPSKSTIIIHNSHLSSVIQRQAVPPTSSIQTKGTLTRERA